MPDAGEGKWNCFDRQIMRSTAIDKNLISGSSCFYPEFYEFRVISKFYQAISLENHVLSLTMTSEKPSIDRHIYIMLL